MKITILKIACNTIQQNKLKRPSSTIHHPRSYPSTIFPYHIPESLLTLERHHRNRPHSCHHPTLIRRLRFHPDQIPLRLVLVQLSINLHQDPIPRHLANTLQRFILRAIEHRLLYRAGDDLLHHDVLLALFLAQGLEGLVGLEPVDVVAPALEVRFEDEFVGAFLLDVLDRVDALWVVLLEVDSEHQGSPQDLALLLCQVLLVDALF